MASNMTSLAALPTRADVPFVLCADPGEFLQLATAWSRCPELWIDTETADWQTSHPRLSLLQVRTPDGGLFVVDILAAGMRAVLETAFVPAVMANSAIRKWAHSASYDRRFLGGERVQNLQCTLRLAKSIPYHRLPTRKLTLGALAAHLCGSNVDKAHQGDDWGVRPLSAEQLAYAAADPEWCRRVQQALDGLVVAFGPASEDPSELREKYFDVTGRLRERKARREDIRDAVRDHLLAESGETFGGFRLHRRLVPLATIAELVRVASELDPGQTLDFVTAVPRLLTADLDARHRGVVRALCTVKAFRAFRGPRIPGHEPRAIYPVATTSEDEVDRQYAEIDDARRRLDSEREELRCRLKAWMEMKELADWEGFRIADPEERWSANMRALVDVLPAAAAREIQVPKSFVLAFGSGVLDRLQTTSRESAFVMWRQRVETQLDPEASQSRDWHEAASEAETG
jgi:ribonuclease D